MEVSYVRFRSLDTPGSAPRNKSNFVDSSHWGQKQPYVQRAAMLCTFLSLTCTPNMLEFNTLVKPLCMAINFGERVQAVVFTV